jgi:hypothetical protein
MKKPQRYSELAYNTPMKYSGILSIGTLRSSDGPNHVLKPDDLWLDMFLGTVLLVLCIIFFVFWFGARLRRATKGSLRGK